MKKMNINMEKITPAIAEDMLSRPIDNNRKISKNTVLEYQSAMQRGLWDGTNPNSIICISKTNRLLDGQHRLTAVVKGNVEVEMLVARDVDDSCFKTMDNGKKRTAADFTVGKYAGDRAALATKVLCLERGVPFETLLSYSGGLSRKGNYRFPTRVESSERANADDTIYWSCVQAARMRTSLGCGRQAALGIFVYCVKTLGEDDELDSFVEEICCNDNENNALVSWKNLFFKAHLSNKEKPNNIWTIGAIYRAYESYKECSSVKKINAIPTFKRFAKRMDAYYIKVEAEQ